MPVKNDNKDEYYTDKLNEKFYYVKETDSIDKINQELEKFLKEIITSSKLKNNNSKDIDGLQAVMVFRHSDCVGKICETNANYHGVTLINCYEYLNNKNKFLTLKGYNNNELLRDYDVYNHNYVNVRIDTSRNELIFAIISNKVFNDFQLSIIKRIHYFCKFCKNKSWCRSVSFLVSSPNINYKTKSFNTDFDKIINDNTIKKAKSK